jgi:hypothetical protein
MKKKLFAMVAFVFLLTMATFSFVGMVHGVEPFYNITALYLKNSEAGIGDRLDVELYMLEKDDSTNIVGYFLNENMSYVSLLLNDINTDAPYFEIPSTMQAGTTYKMTVLDVSDSKGKITYNLTTPGVTGYMNPMDRNVVHIKEQASITGFELLSGKDIQYDSEIKLRLTTDQEVSLATVLIRNKDFPSARALVSVNVNSDSTIDLPIGGGQNLTLGEYQITDVFLNPNDSNKFVHYSVNPEDQTTKKLNYNIEFNLVDNNGSGSDSDSTNTDGESILKSISLSPETVGLNGKVNVTIESTKKLSSATLIFNNYKESMTVNLKGLDAGSPYFVVPFTTGEGTYELGYAILKDENGEKYQYRKGSDNYGVKHFDFTSAIIISNTISDGDLLTFDNNKITDEIVNKIKELEDNIVIEVNANENPIIRKETFDAIKGVNKTLIVSYADYEWVFNGLDIDNPKQVDVSAKIYNTDDADFADGKVSGGLVLDFPENGDLPGKCLIKVYDTKFISNILHRGNVNVYYYNDESGMFELVESDLSYNDKGFYEFYITHNSNYVMTSGKIDPKYVSGVDENKTPMIIAISLSAALVVIVAIIAIVMVKKKSNKNNATVTIDEPQQPLGTI